MRKSSAYAAVLVDAARLKAGFKTAIGVDWARQENSRVECLAPECVDKAGNGRPFFGTQALRDHAEAVHTFDDIRRILSEYLREKFGRTGDYNADPVVPGIWVWIDDLATDWVVFQREEGNESTLLKATYAIGEGNEVTLGDPVEVVRRTVYDPVS